MVLHVRDLERIDRLAALVLEADPLRIAEQVVPEQVARLLIEQCDFAHAALLIFADDERDLVSALATRGFVCTGPVPSTVVRDRLQARYHLAEPPSVRIVHARTVIADKSTRELEIFLAPSRLPRAAAEERVHERESHIAFATDMSATQLDRMCQALSAHGMVRDGGGVNPHENTTTIYFRRARPAGHLYRIELMCDGCHTELLDRNSFDRVPFR